MNGTGLLNDVMSAVGKFLCKVHGVREDHNYSPMFPTFFHSNQKQQVEICDQEVTNLLWTMLEELKDILDSSNTLPKKIRYWMNEKRPTSDVGIQTNSNIVMNDNKFVQITCDNTEFNRRIDAFVKRKRDESDAFNRREFCQMLSGPDEISCARTDAIFVPRQSKKSLLKIERVVNNNPNKDSVSLNTESMKAWPPTHPSSTIPFNKLPDDIKERMNNLSTVLNTNKSVGNFGDVYKHIKTLESRVLYLESLSPEYFRGSIKETLGKSDFLTTHAELIEQQLPEQSKNKENAVLLDMRIKELQEKLQSKAKELRNT